MKIELEKIKFRNIYSFGNKWQEFEFKTGINIITGKDLNSNKSNGVRKKLFIWGYYFWFIPEEQQKT